MANKILLFIFLPFIAFSQDIQFKTWNSTTNTYGAATIFPASAVAEDFGPRRSGTHRWHGGIDYNSGQDDGDGDKWDMILAPEDGTIVDENRLWTTQWSYKQLCYQAGDHRYIFGHVYDNTGASYVENDSRIILKNMLGDDDDKWAQILIVGTDTIVYGQIDGGLVAFNGDTLTTTTTVTAGNPLVPLGDAGINGAHLHLNTIPLNRTWSNGNPTRSPWKSNPLQYLDYNDPTLNVNLYCKNDASIFLPIYPGNLISPMASKVEMETTVSGAGNKRYSHIFDVDSVKFAISKVVSIINRFDF